MMAFPRNVRLQFSAQRSLDSAMIQFFTWANISHVDFILPVTGMLLGARPSCGVQTRQPEYGKFSRIIVAEVEHSAPFSKTIHNLALREQGKPYDRGAICNFFFHRNWRAANRWFCSELVAWAFEQAGSPLFSSAISHGRITPRDLLLSDRVRVIQDTTPGRLSS